MTFDFYLAFVGATAALMLIPGPNVALITGISVARGLRAGLASVAGTSSAMAIQLVLVALGLNAVLLAISGWFHLLRWAGVVYLVYLGVCMWRAPSSDPREAVSLQSSYRSAYGRGLLVSLTNPKTLFFYGAFFPQFIAPNDNPAAQLAWLALTFLVIAVVIDSGWALAAARLHKACIARTRTNNRVAGSLIIGAGIGLALARKS